MRSDDAEELYRQHFLRADAVQAVAVIGLWAITNLVFVWNDNRLAGLGATFWILIAVRAVSLVAGALAALTLLRSKSPRLHDRAVTAWLAVFVVANFYIISTRPPEYLGHGVIAMVALSAIYFVVPGPLFGRSAAALALSLTTFWFARKAPVPPIGWSALLAGHALSHVLGIPLGRRFDKLRREGYFAQLDQQRAREELAVKARDLEAAKERAETLAKAKSDFLATMSHEFRTPMNAVLGLTDVLADTPLVEEQRELVSTIHDSAQSLLVLLNDILDLAKIESGRMAFERIPVDVREVVRSAVDVVHYQAAEKSLVVDLSIDRAVPAGITGDVARLRQVLVSLLSNAIKFTDKGSVSVKVTARNRLGNERELKICIKDTGVGIAPELIGRLFEPFEPRGAGGPDRGGAGLGLSLVKRLVDFMGGKIRVESEVGAGSMFELSLPVRDVKLPPPISRPKVIPFQRGYELKILLAEDNLLNQRVGLAALARLGCRADIANNGQEAVTAAATERYDVVLMDLRMPVMGGIEAAQQILAKLPPGRRPHIIAMTANAFEEDRKACREVGMAGFVSKPVQIEELYAALRATGAEVLAPSVPSSPLPPVTSPRVPQPSPSAITAPGAITIHEAAAAPPAAATAPPAPAPAPVDGGGAVATLSKKALDKLRELEDPTEPGFFVEVCSQFVSDAEGVLRSAQAAALAGDIPAAQRAAHTLKSMSASVGAMEMSSQCAMLEAEAKQGRLDGFDGGVAGLRKELARVERALSLEIGKPVR